MERTNEQLDELCREYGISAFICGQGFMETLNDVLGDNPGLDPREAKLTAMSLLLEENVPFGRLDEEYDTEDDHPDRLEARWDILEELAEGWVDGKYSRMDECEADCHRKAEEWLELWG